MKQNKSFIITWTSSLLLPLTIKNKKPPSLSKKRKSFIGELESLLQTCSSTTGIPEPAQFNHFEGAGNYVVYLSKLAKKSNTNGY